MMNESAKRLDHVVVLMMENRSFDHLLGNFQRIDPACDGVLGQERRCNRVAALGQDFFQQAEAPGGLALQLLPTPFDPHHEFVDCLVQLGDLQQPSMSGFAENAYQGYHDQDGCRDNIAELVQRVMNYIPFGATPETDPLPGLQGLARAFTVCDHWFSPVPGPTFCNRFFAMKGSASGRVLMPASSAQLELFITDYADEISKDSIFSLLTDAGHDARVYSQGPTPFAFMVRGGGERLGMEQFRLDAAAGCLPALSWLEPDYNYTGSDGCAQHPPEDLRYGDAFIAQAYNALRGNDAAWRKTLFVVLYDEAGGFYDHLPPPAALAPDGFPADVPFDFTRCGGRVPAILASPWLARTVDPGVYDHTSLLAFICDRFGLDRARLGLRVAGASHFGEAPIWLEQPRDTPERMLEVAQPPRSQALTDHESGLAASLRMLIQGLAARVDRDAVETGVLEVARPLASGAGEGVYALQQLGWMVARIAERFKGGPPAPAAGGAPSGSTPPDAAPAGQNPPD